MPAAGGPGFDFAGVTNKVGAPSFAFLAKGGYTNVRSCEAMPHGPGTKSSSSLHSRPPARLRSKIETVTAPPPLLRCADQASLHRIAMHIPELLHALLRRPYAEVVGARLPERSALRLVSKQIALARVPPFAFGQQRASRALLQHLHHGRGSPNFRFRQKQVNVFRHHDITDDYEAITLASLFQYRKEGIAAAGGT
jgi:hypothetical protein